MSFFNLFFKNLLGYKIEKSDIIRDNSVKEIKFNSIEKYKNDKLVNKLNMDNRDYLFIDYQSLDDQLQKITNELNDLKLNSKSGGDGKGKKRFNKSGKKNKIESLVGDKRFVEEIAKDYYSLITGTPQQSILATPQQSILATPQQSILATPQQSILATPQQSNLVTPDIIIAYGSDSNMSALIDENEFETKYKELRMNYD